MVNHTYHNNVSNGSITDNRGPMPVAPSCPVQSFEVLLQAFYSFCTLVKDTGSSLDGTI